MFINLDPIELITLFGCLTRAADSLKCQAQHPEGYGADAPTNAQASVEAAWGALTVMDTLVYKLSGNSTAREYAYYIQEYRYASV